MLRGFNVAPSVSVIRTEMDVGMAKMRRRSTVALTTTEGELLCSTAQVEALELFFLESTKGGTVRFQIPAPHTNKPQEARFMEPPQFQWIGGEWWRVRVRLELADTIAFADNAVWPDGDNMVWPDGDNWIWP